MQHSPCIVGVQVWLTDSPSTVGMWSSGPKPKCESFVLVLTVLGLTLFLFVGFRGSLTTLCTCFMLQLYVIRTCYSWPERYHCCSCWPCPSAHFPRALWPLAAALWPLQCSFLMLSHWRSDHPRINYPTLELGLEGRASR